MYPSPTDSPSASFFAKEQESMLTFEKSSQWKRELLARRPFDYILRAILSSFFIGLACMACFVSGNYFYSTNPGIAYLLASGLFCVALLLIIYGNGELFTSNVMYLTIACSRKKVSIAAALKILAVCYLANLAGALIFGLLIHYTGIVSDPSGEHFLQIVAAKKMHGSFSTILVKGILCNWLVCMAIFMYNRVSSETGKMIMVFLIVFCFFICGYEHSIANMGIFSIALLSPHASNISLAEAVHNIVPATIGNLLGGGLFVGLYYSYLNRE